MPEFTQGNWGLFNPSAPRNNPTRERRLLLLHPDGERVIARFDEGFHNSRGPIPSAERLANAKLCQMAPRMYDLLRRLAEGENSETLREEAGRLLFDQSKK